MKELINCKHIAKCLNVNFFLWSKTNFLQFSVVWPLISHDFRHLAVKMLWTPEATSTLFPHSAKPLLDPSRRF